MKVANVSNKNTVLDVACGRGIVACAFAAETLGKLGSEAAIPRLLRAIEDEEFLVRRSAAEALGNFKICKRLYEIWARNHQQLPQAK